MRPLAQNAIALPAAEKGTAATGLMVVASPFDTPAMESHPAWPILSQLPTLLSVAIPLQGLRVRDLLALQPGQLVHTARNYGEDAPLAVGPLQIAWGEFDVLNGNIALRITRLA